MELQQYLNGGIKNITAKAGRFYLGNKNGRRFLAHFVPAAKRAADTRHAAEKNGAPVPPFLIASIATRCNLHCAGCYARANNSVGSGAVHGEMTASEWERVFGEAAGAGVSFILLAGGEPMLRMDVLEAAARVKDIVFPVFTNGTLFTKDKLDFFDNNRNLVPVLSIEGDAAATDARRGEGVAQKLAGAAQSLKGRGILFGASLTVTAQNYGQLADPAYVGALAAAGCAAMIYVEYVPAEAGTEALALTDEQNAALAAQIDALRTRYKDMVLLSFPGDEQAMGGCLAAGRGFFHINANGGAEPCPFSPYSDVSLKTHSLTEALQSPLFKALRTGGLLDKPHTGGCVLFEQQAGVQALVSGE